MGMTMVEKILARATGQDVVQAGDVVEPKVDLAMLCLLGSQRRLQAEHITRRDALGVESVHPMGGRFLCQFGFQQRGQ